MTAIPNVFAERYASQAMTDIWSARAKVILEREFWIALMKAQQSLGLEIGNDAIAAYEAVIDQVDLDSIAGRERTTRHDVKARIDEFCELADRQDIHKGMTSRDLTENIEQLQIHRALREVRFKTLATLNLLSQRAREYRDLPVTARTHNVAAQTTTLGKRFAMFGEELLGAFEQLEGIIASYPVRGLKGAVGTQLDQFNLFEGDPAAVTRLETTLLEHLGFTNGCIAMGQVYPRSLDLRVVSALCEIGGAPSSFAVTLRLMAGHGLGGEGFAPGQTGSSAMPHKMNSRSCERINGFQTLLRGYVSMAASLTGDQWNEGDVSCSVVRRVMLPDSFFAIDGMLETTITVLRQMRVHEAVIAREHRRYLPFLLSTTFLMEAVKAGIGREAAHESIKEHAVAALEVLRSGESSENDFIARLAGDDRIGMTSEQLDKILHEASANIGAAPAQVDSFCARVDELIAQDPSTGTYEPRAIL